MLSWPKHFALGVVTVALAGACGGTTIVDDGAGQGDAGAGSTGAGPGSGDGGGASASASAQAGSASRGGAGVGGASTGCGDHADCPDELCVFASGTCSPACKPDAACPPGFACNPCGTGSCPGCDDCLAVCLPIPDYCEDHDDCKGGDVCVYDLGRCRPKCGVGLMCAVGTCQGCATSSCPQCKDCIAACMF
jgi:hypothetical protein